ncbi:MAG TPA: hypothetical protein VLH08_05465 [Acidobacteriota bacterium]|nr:hypothetical protein [Acidobacteriota bacterium]
MSPSISGNRVAYPDVSHQISDLVTQQPEPEQAPGIKLRKAGKDEYRAIQAAGLTKLDILTRRGIEPMATFGHIPKPDHWNASRPVFHEAASKEALRSAAVALGLNGKLDEMLAKVAGQITDVGFAASDVKSLLPKDFRGLVFRAEPGNTHQESVRFIRERSMHSLDELRSRLSTNTSSRASIIQDNSERANALLQLRTKLGQLRNLAALIDQTFSDLDAVQLGRLKTPQLC